MRAGRHRLRVGENLLHPVDELLRLERLRHLAVRSDRNRPRGIARTAPAEEKHRRLLERRVGADLLAKLVTVEPRHVDVGEDEIGLQIPRPLERLRPVRDGGERKVLPLENHPDSGADRRRVVGQKEGLRHAGGASGKRRRSPLPVLSGRGKLLKRYRKREPLRVRPRCDGGASEPAPRSKACFSNRGLRRRRSRRRPSRARPRPVPRPSSSSPSRRSWPRW